MLLYVTLCYLVFWARRKTVTQKSKRNRHQICALCGQKSAYRETSSPLTIVYADTSVCVCVASFGRSGRAEASRRLRCAPCVASSARQTETRLRCLAFMRTMCVRPHRSIRSSSGSGAAVAQLRAGHARSAPRSSSANAALGELPNAPNQSDDDVHPSSVDLRARATVSAIECVCVCVLSQRGRVVCVAVVVVVLSVILTHSLTHSFGDTDLYTR